MPKVKKKSAGKMNPNVKLIFVGAKQTGSAGILHFFNIDREMNVDEMVKSVKAHTKREGCVEALLDLLSNFDIKIDENLDYNKWEQIKEEIVIGGKSKVGTWKDSSWRGMPKYNPFDPTNGDYDEYYPYGKMFDKGSLHDYYRSFPPTRMRNRLSEPMLVSVTLLFADEPIWKTI